MLTGKDVAVNAVRMPGEYEAHERTLMCWPARADLWGAHLRQAELDYAEIAQQIARFEPVTMIAAPAAAETAADLCGSNVEVVEIPIDDSWARDTGPDFVVDESGVPEIVDFTFNAWGEKFAPYADDARLAERWAQRTGRRRRAVPMVLEGGSIATDGERTLVTTEECLLHMNRNPDMTRAQIEATLADALGVEAIVWLPFGLALDADTDGHVDNVAAFIEPGRLLVQGCDNPAEDDHRRTAINRRCAEGAIDACGRELEVVVVPVLPYAEVDGRRLMVPYLNLYVLNGAVIVPTSGHPADDEMLGLIGSCYPGREVVPVPATMLAFGGGGPHCITQQVPARA